MTGTTDSHTIVVFEFSAEDSICRVSCAGAYGQDPLERPVWWVRDEFPVDSRRVELWERYKGALVESPYDKGALIASGGADAVELRELYLEVVSQAMERAGEQGEKFDEDTVWAFVFPYALAGRHETLAAHASLFSSAVWRADLEEGRFLALDRSRVADWAREWTSHEDESALDAACDIALAWSRAQRRTAELRELAAPGTRWDDEGRPTDFGLLGAMARGAVASAWQWELGILVESLAEAVQDEARVRVTGEQSWFRHERGSTKFYADDSTHVVSDQVVHDLIARDPSDVADGIMAAMMSYVSRVTGSKNIGARLEFQARPDLVDADLFERAQWPVKHAFPHVMRDFPWPDPVVGRGETLVPGNQTQRQPYRIYIREHLEDEAYARGKLLSAIMMSYVDRLLPDVADAYAELVWNHLLDCAIGEQWGLDELARDGAEGLWPRDGRLTW